MSNLPSTYDAWRLAGPDDLDPRDVVGTEDGDPCNRYAEPDEDAPRGWRPRPCRGVMVENDDGDVTCDLCGVTA